MFADGNIIFNVYAADGRKLEAIYLTKITENIDAIEVTLGNTNDISEINGKHYIGNFEYEYSVLEDRFAPQLTKVFNAEGYVEEGNWYYFRKDHLGNNREVAVVNGTTFKTVQTNNYYPSGLLWSDGKVLTIDNGQPYKYNGKEYIEDFGYDCFAYGFRDYYATIGRFTSIDPLAEMSYSSSPYAYAANNPVKNIDWLGLSTYTTSDPDEIAALLSHLGSGGSVDDFDFSCWEYVGSWDGPMGDKWAIADLLNKYWFGGGGSGGGGGIGGNNSNKFGTGGGKGYMADAQPQKGTNNGDDVITYLPPSVRNILYHEWKWNLQQADNYDCVFMSMTFALNKFAKFGSENVTRARRKASEYKGLYKDSNPDDFTGGFRGVQTIDQLRKFLATYFDIVKIDYNGIKDAIDNNGLVFVAVGKDHCIVIVGYNSINDRVIFYDPQYGCLYNAPASNFHDTQWNYTMWNSTGLK